jgi:hypothetical protein
MLGMITLAGGAIVVGISYMVDASGTVHLVVNAITIRGITWIIKKVVATMDVNKADLINLAGWSFAGINMALLLVNVKKGITPIVKDIGDTVSKIKEIKADINAIGDSIDGFLERITWWN